MSDTTVIIQNAPEAVKQLAMQLDDSDPGKRKAAVESLVRSGHSTAREVLQAATRHPLQDVRILVTFWLAQLKDTSAVPNLIRFLRGIDQPVDEGVAEILTNMWDKQAETTQEAAQLALAWIGAEAIDSLRQALRDEEDPHVHTAIVETLGMIGSAAIPGLIEDLQNGNQDTRWSSAWLLGAISDPTAVPNLAESLRDEDEDPNIRLTSYWALANIGTAEALEIVKEWEPEIARIQEQLEAEQSQQGHIGYDPNLFPHGSGTVDDHMLPEYVQIEFEDDLPKPTSDDTGAEGAEVPVEAGATSLDQILDDVKTMKQYYKDYSPATAREIIDGLPKAWDFSKYEAKTWGASVIGEVLVMTRETVSRYMKAFWMAGIREVNGIKIPYRPKAPR